MRFAFFTSLVALAALIGGGCRAAPEVGPEADIAPAPQITVGPQPRALPAEPGFIDPPTPAVQLASFADATGSQLAILATGDSSPPGGSSSPIRRTSNAEPLPRASAITSGQPSPSLTQLPETIAAPERPLTLSDALAIALARNPDLLVNRQDVAIAGAQQVAANTYPFNPTFEAQVQSANNNEPLRQHIRQSYSVLQEIETGGKGTYRRGEAAAGVDRAQWELRQRELELRAAVYVKFAALLSTTRKLELARETTRLNSQFVDNIRSLLNAGKAAGGDLLIAQEDVSDARQAELAAAAERSVAEADLRLTLGLADPGELMPQGEIALPDAEGPIDFDALSAAAGDNQPEVRAKAAALAQADAAVALAHANQRADITAGPALEIDENKTFFAGATLQVPLQFYNKKQGELLQAEAEREKAAADLEQTRLKVKLGVRSAWEQYAAARRTTELLAIEVLPASQRHLQDAQRLLDAGQMDLLRLMELRRRNLAIRQQLLDAQHQMVVHRIEFETLTGRLLTAESDSRLPPYDSPAPNNPLVHP